MSAEAIATLNPDLILVMSKGLESVGGVEGLIALPGVAQTDAGKNGVQGGVVVTAAADGRMQLDAAREAE